MSPAYIMDTSFLLELNEIPGHSNEEQIATATKKYTGIINSASKPRIYITVPILLEYAGFLSRIRRGEGKAKREYATQLNKDINNSLEHQIPWVIHGIEKEFLLKTRDIIALSERFIDGVNDYSFADLSIVQAKEQLGERHNEIQILTFEEELASHSTAH